MTDLQRRLESILGSTYTIERELGGGGMSRVFLAEETALGRRVVIKVLPPELSAEVSADRFRREMRVAAQLQHPHIVPVLQSGESEGLLYYTMPFVDGESLRALVARQGALPVSDVVRILRDVLDALIAAHAHGVVHRDIKPDNVLTTGQHALVTDFGVAKAISAAAGSVGTSTGVTFGTPAYMAPEQVAADPNTDHRADIYAVGVLAYELLTGRPPFTASSPQAILAAHVTQTPEPVTKHRPAVSRALADLVTRCLSKHPADRPQSATELWHELEKAAQPASAELGAPRARSRGRPVVFGAILLLAAIATTVWLVGRGGARSAATNRSVAVLPFVNVGGDSTDEYFSDGMTDEITTVLGKVPALNVASRTSSFMFKRNPTGDLRQIGRQLQVEAILGGSVQRAGGKIRVRVQLTNVADNFVMWSETYEGDARDVFQLQENIARSIAGALRVRLGGTTALAERPTGSLEAYDLFLKGRYAWNQRTGKSLEQAVRYFEQAIADDPHFARAYAGLAESYVLLPFYATVRPLDAWPKAKDAAQRALAEDSTLAEARAAFAYGQFLYERDFKSAEDGFRRAIAADPRYATAHQFYGDMLGADGRVEERLAELKRAQELDPLSRIIGHEIAQTLFVMGRFDEAITQLEQTLALDPSFAPGSRTLGLLYFRTGRRAEGFQFVRRSLELSGRRPIDVGHLARMYSLAGQRDSAVRLVAELEDRAKREYIASFALAIAYTGLGDTDRAFALLDKGAENYEPSLAENWFDPALDSLHSDPRWKRFLARMGVRTDPTASRDRAGR